MIISEYEDLELLDQDTAQLLVLLIENGCTPEEVRARMAQRSRSIN